MKIQYTLGLDDLWRYNKFLISHVSSYKFRFILRLAMVPIAILLLFLSQQFSWWVCLAATIGIASVWIPFCVWSLRRHYLKTIQDQPGVIGQHALEINLEGVRQTTSFSNSLMAWNGFSEIIENEHLNLFFLNPKFAVVIPKHAFSSNEEAQRFLTIARAYWKGNPAPVEAEHKPEIWPPPPRIGA